MSSRSKVQVQLKQCGQMKSILKQNLRAVVLITGILGVIPGCTNELEDTGQLRLYLINGPASYDSVVLVVTEVSLRLQNQEWIVVNNTTRTLHLPLTANVLLGETSLEAAHYSQIRLLLDTTSYVVVNGKQRPLITPGQNETGLELAHQFRVDADVQNTLYVGFDVRGNACICVCCKQFKSVLHIYTNAEALGRNTRQRMKASRGQERCKCGDRWDHRQYSAKHCRHCAPLNSSMGAIG